MIRTVYKLMVLLLLSMGFAYVKADTVKVKPSLLFITGAHAADGLRVPQAVTVKRIEAKGFTVDSIKWKDVTTNKLYKYDCLIIAAFGKTHPGKELEPEVTQRFKIINEYIKSGGAVLLSPYMGEDPQDLYVTQLFLDKYGATVKLLDMNDPGREMILPPWHLRYTWTDKINRDFLGLSENDKYLWYPVGPYKYGTRSYVFDLNDKWTSIVKTDDTVSFKTRSTGVPYFDKKQTGGEITGKLPLIAVRKSGSGRLAVLGIFHPYTLSDPFAPSFGNVFMEKGFGNRKSCGFNIIAGLLKWLTADAENINRARPEKTNSLLLEPFMAKRAAVKPTLHWQKRKFPKQDYKKGSIFLIPDDGVVESYIKAAKKSDLDFVVFAKKIDAFKDDHKELNVFKKICFDASTTNFTVVPALILKDIYGGSYLYCGKNIQYPSDEIFDESTQSIKVPSKDMPGSNGELGDGWMHYVFGQVGSMQAVIASVNHKGAEYPASDCRDYNSMVIMSCEKGKVIENMKSEFLRLQDRGENLLPLALHKIISSGEIAGIVQKKFWLTYVAADDIIDFFSRQHMLDDPRVYITAGPKIKAWVGKGPRDFSNTGNIYDYSQWHYDIKLDVAAEGGLKDVVIYDGSELFREFKVAGSNEFSVTLPILHDRQYNLTLVVRDIAGNEAVSAELLSRSHISEEFMCGDRNNQLFYSVQRRIRGGEPLFSRGGIGGGVTPNKGPWSGENCMTGAYSEDPYHRTHIMGFDGGAGNSSVAYTLPGHFIKGELPLRADPDRVFNSSDVAISRTRLNTGFPLKSKVSNVWHTLLPVLPTIYMDAIIEQFYFTPRPFDDMPVLKQRVTIKFKKEYQSENNKPFLFTMVRGDMREKMSWLVKSSTGTVYAGTFKEQGKESVPSFVIPFGRGSYLRMGEGTVGSYTIVSLTDGLVLSERRNSRRFTIGFPENGKPVPVGEEFTAEFIFIGEPFNGPAHNINIENVVNSIINGDEQNLKINVSLGQITDRGNYPILALAENGTWKAEIKSNIAAAIPFQISGFSVNNSCYLYFPDKNRWRPVGVADDGSVYLSMPGVGDETVVICEPLINSDKRLQVTLVQTEKNKWAVNIINNSDEQVDTVLKINPVFIPFGKLDDIRLFISPHGYENKKIDISEKVDNE